LFLLRDLKRFRLILFVCLATTQCFAPPFNPFGCAMYYETIREVANAGKSAFFLRHFTGPKIEKMAHYYSAYRLAWAQLRRLKRERETILIDSSNENLDKDWVEVRREWFEFTGSRSDRFKGFLLPSERVKLLIENLEMNERVVAYEARFALATAVLLNRMDSSRPAPKHLHITASNFAVINEQLDVENPEAVIAAVDLYRPEGLDDDFIEWWPRAATKGDYHLPREAEGQLSDRIWTLKKRVPTHLKNALEFHREFIWAHGLRPTHKFEQLLRAMERYSKVAPLVPVNSLR
jgi:hypothetical protein